MASEQFKTAHLNAHNNYRAKHGCPPVQMSAAMCTDAQQWAQYLANTRVMKHRTNRKYGENLYMVGSSSSVPIVVKGEAPVASWYSEVKNFRYGVSGFSMHTGHFTQVVWKATTRIGVGVASNRSGQTYVVTNYDPHGNYQGQFTANVPRPV